MICAAYKRAAEQFHSGMMSRGYAKLCQVERIGYREGLGTAWKIKGSDERSTLAALLWKRRREIRREW